MAKNTAYKVLSEELTIHKQIGELTDPITGRVIGIQQGQGKTYFKGEIVPEDAVSPLLIEALENESHPSHKSVNEKLEVVSDSPSDDTAIRLGLPFDGYEKMSEEEILSAMVVLPSPTIQRIKAYETAKEGRTRIVGYSIGFGESSDDRALDLVGSKLDDDNRDNSDKAVSRLTTREVPDEGVVQQGEGITGIGVPSVPYGEGKDEDEAPRPNVRKGRRQRQKPTPPAEKSSE